ncbi:hypothetical protein MLP_48820 [Microlunatus phosphovorus NM-1]|uniref:Aminoglycoside phosphotransferase domain-containing protein n=1 Tax=Microlunatus phosphovorus (strain ATCC 700054 / DSM 10555 / JCM 9379 / NBRC 101784 / NCIMB 13414 / VKM Ac-1990 / NM-1) TaxID=1032480 RepID=F5XFW2_MICPN|nr:hypothetical protein MLP_48820 [Microlunatus phosphovorus NM-1]
MASGAYGFNAADADIERLVQRIKNVNFRIRLGQQDWILKCHRPGSVKNLGFSQGLEELLVNAGFPVAKLQISQNGQALVQHGEMFFTLHDWVPGQQITIDQRDKTLERHPDLTQELGAALGRLHRLGEPLLTSASAPIDGRWLLTGPRRTVTSIRRGRPPQVFKAARLRVRPRKSEFDQWILSELPRLYRVANRLADETSVALLDSDDVVVAHNDLNWENLIFGPTFRLRALLDFDNATPLPRALDVGAAVAVLVGSATARIDQFLASYASESGHHVDRDLVTLGMRWKCARSMLWSIDSYLSGRIADSRMVANWCRHLDDCLKAIAD